MEQVTDKKTYTFTGANSRVEAASFALKLAEKTGHNVPKTKAEEGFFVPDDVKEYIRRLREKAHLL